MAIVNPFCGVRYNGAKIKDPGKVVSPPYDVIADEELRHLNNLSPYNFTHIDLPKEQGGMDRYASAKQRFDEWMKTGVLTKDDKPSLYVYRQEYKYQGQKYNRLGFIGAMRIEDGRDSKVYPHENTHAKAVDDRLAMCKNLKADLSPIFVCYSDRSRQMDKIFIRHIAPQTPLFEVEDPDKVKHLFWRLSDPALIAQIQQTVEGQPLFIADGHHRFKVAQEYRRLCKERNPAGDDEAPYNFVLTYFTNLDSRDLQIFPMHRIVTRLTKPLHFLDDYFRTDRVKTVGELLIILARAGRNENAFGLYTREGIRLLRLKNKRLVNDKVKEGSAAYKALDAAILKSFVFDEIGLESKDIIYTKDIQRVTAMVDAGEAEAGFIMNSVPIQQLKDVALSGDKMPPKTTYFYPKVLSGLVVLPK
ncbi:MAG: DUF1015 domain-containing protein [Candidatus Omnitrophica bacterium]|nr:DUF1015 domain-containing protein [Candidatus Omnitrophota bacterium]